MTEDQLALDTVRDTRARMASHLEELRRLHLALVDDTRAMKAFSFDGRALAEIELASEMLEQYLTASSAFLENLHGRFDARIALLRRSEPVVNGKRQDAVGHAEFWMAYSRLNALLRRVARSADA